ncbi:serine hydrolase domain-containing protein [Portibacter lacus]|uniref:Serine hydrolase n=1 Tax=Portibacter lacus TaxID=1099794 RepID=A0AA37SJA2_9BACT|nr:serine hydrolase domain-containing protein [Portibacter lacus]GLR15788.1 serine hydrolase [Portibacter lacus]
MRIFIINLLLLFIFVQCDKTTDPIIEEEEENDTELYFPPNNSDEWDTYSIAELDWNEEATADLYDFLESNGTRGFLILKDGKIVIEKYWNKGILNQEFTQSSNWYWASAGKTLTSFLIGQAQEDGYLDITKSSSEYLGSGWSTLTEEQEKAITVRHHLTMTTGLDTEGDIFCTDKECLNYMVPPGERWYYHNAPYTILDQVIENATNQSFDDYFESKLRDPIGMDGFWFDQDYNHVYSSTPRSMARFGLLMLNKGIWKDQVILDDMEYIEASVSTSQELNPAYGYLWWLNGKDQLVLPSIPLTLNMPLSQTAPDDMYAAMGKNSQLINIVPSENLIVIRMGSDPDNSLVPTTFQDDMWTKINKLIFK